MFLDVRLIVADVYRMLADCPVVLSIASRDAAGCPRPDLYSSGREATLVLDSGSFTSRRKN